MMGVRARQIHRVPMAGPPLLLLLMLLQWSPQLTALEGFKPYDDKRDVMQAVAFNVFGEALMSSSSTYYLSQRPDVVAKIREACYHYRPPSRGKILLGVDASPCEFPYLVALSTDQEGGKPHCAGAILRSKVVVTAAHCVQGFEGSLYVEAGKYERAPTEKGTVQKVRVTKAVVHAQYNVETLQNDVAVLTLNQALTWSRCVRPSCLPEPGEKPNYQEACYVAGWGTNSVAPKASGKESFPKVLQKVELQPYSLERCTSLFSQLVPGLNFYNGTMCTYSGGVQDAHEGDSGGPLVCLGEDAKYKVFGLVSYGDKSGTETLYPTFYTDVSHFLEFILSPNPGSTIQYP